MFIKRMVIEGVGGEVDVARVDEGARITAGDRIVCELRRTDNDDTRWAVALLAATEICGTDRRGRPNATNRMIQDVLRELERAAGC